MVEVERELWRSPPDQAGPPTASCPGLCLDGFWIRPRREITISLGNLCLCSVILTVRKPVLVFRPCLGLCPFSLVLSLNTAEKSLDESFLQSPFRCLHTFIVPSLFLLFGMKTPNSLSCSSYASCSRPLNTLVPLTGLSPVCPGLYCHETPRNGHSTSSVAK